MPKVVEEYYYLLLGQKGFVILFCLIYIVNLRVSLHKLEPHIMHICCIDEEYQEVSHRIVTPNNCF